MQKFKTLSDAIALAEFAHRNQTDKAGLPYIEHPKRVLEKVKAQGGLPYVQMAAVLHDVTEDTAFTADMLTELGFSEAVVDIVRLVDRDESEYQFYLGGKAIGFVEGSAELKAACDEYYYTRIRSNPGAVQVKLADIEDNLSPWRLAYLSDETQKRLKDKYAKARMLLQPGVWTNPYFPHGNND